MDEQHGSNATGNRERRQRIPLTTAKVKVPCADGKASGGSTIILSSPLGVSYLMVGVAFVVAMAASAAIYRCDSCHPADAVVIT